MSRFDYVKYDEFSMIAQVDLKAAAQIVEAQILDMGNSTQGTEPFELSIKAFREKAEEHLANKASKRALELVKTACVHVSNYAKGGNVERALEQLEVAYMWCGKGIRDEQVAQRGAELQESRGDE